MELTEESQEKLSSRQKVTSSSMCVFIIISCLNYWLLTTDYLLIITSYVLLLISVCLSDKFWFVYHIIPYVLLVVLIKALPRLLTGTVCGTHWRMFGKRLVDKITFL